VEKAMKEVGEKLDPGKRERTEKALEKLKDAVKGDDIEKIKKATEELSKESQELFAAVYAEAAAKRAEEEKKKEEKKGEGDKDKDKGDVVDADYKVKDDR
jgi:molecular chaperone DnaK